MRIRKDDKVLVLAGKYKGASGKVLKVFPERKRVLVEGIAMAKRHTKPSPQMQSGGILDKEMPVDVSNVKLVCPKCSKPARTGVKVQKDGKRVRFCKTCNEVI
jgi:large subunit ribosomal protein L24